MENQLLDNDLQLAEQEVQIRWAGFWIRVGASLVDFLVYLPIVGLNLYNLYRLKSFPLQIIISIIILLYKPLMEYKYGATLGKMGVGIKVVDQNMRSISLQKAIIRYTPWLISHAVSLYGSILLFTHPDFAVTRNWIEVGQLQSDQTSTLLNTLGSLFLIISCLVIAFSNKKQGLHDMMAKTYCIYKEN